ncbi:MAG: right-handed parallel beta-helix repeat-containing protein [Fibrobacter sp.]|nr:right-handed parallel beta-helix repeat-containing protein [Fibrobacter sp.]
MLRPRLFLSVSLLLVTTALAGEMPFPQPEKGLVRLVAKDSPYILEQGVVLSSTDTFVVEPGVTVLMGEYAKIMLRGPVRIQGSPEKPIVFRSADSSASWNGIHFVSSSKPFDVRNLVVENAFRNTVFRTDGIFHQVKFVNNYYGLWVDEVAQMYLTDCEFSRNRFALSLRAASVNANNTTISNNVYGLYLEAAAKYDGDMTLVANNLEADVRNESDELAKKGKRVRRNIWQRVEARF